MRPRWSAVVDILILLTVATVGFLICHAINH